MMVVMWAEPGRARPKGRVRPRPSVRARNLGPSLMFCTSVGPRGRAHIIAIFFSLSQYYYLIFIISYFLLFLSRMNSFALRIHLLVHYLTHKKAEAERRPKARPGPRAIGPWFGPVRALFGPGPSLGNLKVLGLDLAHHGQGQVMTKAGGPHH